MISKSLSFNHGSGSTQLQTEHDNKMMQLHPKCLTQGPEEHHNFSDEGQIRFPMVFFTPSHIFCMGFIFSTHIGQSMRSNDLQQLPFLNHMRIVNGTVILVEMDYSIQT
jgi:hypothetical protein